eukprot:scaffold3481_cov75-Cyclotella_meneghiniana.AAC.6
MNHDGTHLIYPPPPNIDAYSAKDVIAASSSSNFVPPSQKQNTAEHEYLQFNHTPTFESWVVTIMAQNFIASPHFQLLNKYDEWLGKVEIGTWAL